MRPDQGRSGTHLGARAKIARRPKWREPKWREPKWLEPKLLRTADASHPSLFPPSPISQNGPSEWVRAGAKVQHYQIALFVSLFPLKEMNVCSMLTHPQSHTTEIHIEVISQKLDSFGITSKTMWKLSETI